MCRSIAIATGKPYAEVHAALNELAKDERTGRLDRCYVKPRITAQVPKTIRI